MLNRNAMKVLKILNKSKSIVCHKLADINPTLLDTCDNLVSLGFAIYEGNPYGVIKITEEGKNFLANCRYELLKFSIPTIISLIALVVSVFAIVR